MKNLPYLLLLLSISLFAQDPVFSEAKLDNARVYFNGAELSHTTSVNLSPGNSEVVITNIANNVNEKTIQLTTDKELTILSVQYTNAYIEEYDDDAHSPINRELKDQIKATEFNLEEISNTLEAKEKAIDVLDQTGSDGPKAVQFSTVNQMSEWIDYYQSQRTTLKNEIYTLSEEKKTVKRKLDDLKTRLQIDDGKAGQMGNGKLIVRVMSEASGNFPLSLNYMTPAAQWFPAYDLYVEKMDDPIQLTYKADISQNTGIDWSETQLSLTSGMLQHNRTLPQWNPWFVGYEKSQPNEDRTAGLEEVAISKYNRAPALKANSSSIAEYLTQSENQLNTTFDIELPYTIISNNKSHTINLKKLEMEGGYTYYTAPKLDNNVYLTAKISDFNKHQLLPGPAQVIFEGTRVGETQLDPETSDEELRLNLGRDSQISMERTLVSDKSGTKMLSSKREQNFRYELKVKNNKNRSVNLKLEDQFPISKDKSIEIDVTEASNGKIDSEKGIITWELSLKPGESKTLIFGYRLKSDKDKEVDY